MTYGDMDIALSNAWDAFFDSLFESNILVTDLDKIEEAIDFNTVKNWVIFAVDLEQDV